MRVRNLTLFLIPVILAIIFSLIVGVRNPAIILAFFIIFDAVSSVISSFIFITYWHKSKKYKELLVSYLKPRGGVEGKIAIVIPVYNEDPWTVVQTAVAAKMAAEGYGDVYVLDDSTDDEIRKKLDEYAKEYEFIVFRRGSRKGYKAGAVNSWLRKHGESYDFMMILDADQRPMPGFAKHILSMFDDPDVAFVQVPQYYSRLDTTIALAAHLQLIPFLRVVMRARHINHSAFSLGSGTVFRIKPLMEVGGLYEKTVTEDIYTSILLHEKGYKSKYLDIPLVWYGEAPLDLKAYWIQQNRWSAGGFQLIPKLLDAKLSTRQLVDYMNGVFYWLHVGLLTMIDIIAPVLFLIFGIYFMSVEPLYYLVFYGSIFAFTFIFYILSMRDYKYGLREYMYHQGIQFVASLPVTIALFQWLTGRKKSFRVTPKKKKMGDVVRYHIYFMTVIVMLSLSIVFGVLKLIYGQWHMLYAYLINMFWAVWWLWLSISAFYVSLSRPVPKRVRERARQTYEGLEITVVDMLACGIEFEKLIGRYYVTLANMYPKYEKVLIDIAKDSFRHARIYEKILNLAKERWGKSMEEQCSGISSYLKNIEDMEKRCGRIPFKECLLPQEEISMYVYAHLVLESCRFIPKKLMDEVEGIAREELDHNRRIRELATGE
ncbi:glycosyl transferase [Aciduliprofundum sp. MAR08-339]|uniref:glycosyltransferase family 2 protein n=1 Tax=Aciduliprofundum sp. (strain MAR08-339) TaxID=673860 RepID=UPI0002A4CC1A|nr:glycosyl transferase [Aciduliprofundum sp. MAR08-339]